MSELSERVRDAWRIIQTDGEGHLNGVVIADEIATLEAEVLAAQRLCEIYFDIAAGVVGEDTVRRLRDVKLEGGEDE